MKFGKLCFLFPLLTLSTAATLLGNSSGPIPGLTAGFHEQTCSRCHRSFKLNEGRTIGGTLEIHDVPRIYEKGKVYPITVIIGQPGQSRWGFELTVRHSKSGQQAGQLTPIDATTQIKAVAGIQYIEHTSVGSRDGNADGPVEFHFNWTAPDPEGGAVFFNAAGNAANGSGTPLGDYIYTAGAYSRGASGAGNILLSRSSKQESGTGGRISETNRLADLPNPVDLNKGSVEIYIQHRFFQSISDSTPGNAFGIDFGANINLGVNYAFTDRFSAGVSRARLDQVIGFNGAYELQTRKESFWKMSLLMGVEGKRNFERQFSPYAQLATSFDYKPVRIHVVPTVVFNSRDDTLLKNSRVRAINPGSNHTFSLGLGSDVALTKSISLIGEIVPRLAGFGGFVKRQPQMAGGLEFRTSAHVFTLIFATSRDFGPSKYAVNADDTNVSLGFNIYRRIK